MQRFPRASSSRAARSAPRATGLVNAVLRRIAREGPEWYAALPEDDARGGRAAPLAARLDRRALVRRLRRGARARALRGGQPRRRRCRCGRTRCATARPRSRPGCARRAPTAVRDEATGVLRVDGPLDVAGSQAFASGAVVPIARAAVLVAQRVGAEPGMRVLDLCAAPGGKTAVLAASGARVTAVDAHPARAKTLEATLRRLGVDAEVVAADGRSFRGGPFDRILVDAPCSGLGVLAGRPDARWRRTPEDTRRAGRPAGRARAARPRRCWRPAASCTTPSARSTPRRTRRSPRRRAWSPRTSCAPGPTRATTASTPRA